ncbi:MAG: matrixin family metalloprotease [Cenarchaeum sp. SB0664_bin_35]|nr:matrixin family metalloprotease [Cenarchaeum sp. SB0664_bin_35]
MYLIIPAITTLTILALITYAAPVSAQETDLDLPLDVSATIIHVVHQHNSSTDEYAFIVEITNLGQDTMFADVSFLDTDAYFYDNECEKDYWVEFSPGETIILAGCYTVDEDELPVYISMSGYMDTDDVDVFRTATIPLIHDGCGDFFGTTNCLTVQNIYDIIDDPEYGGQSGSPSFTINNAQYLWAEDILVLNFTKKINVFSINMSAISITDGRCALAFTSNEYDMSSPDRTSVIIRPNEMNRESLATMTDPQIQLHGGSFTESGTGNMMEPASLPLRMVGSASAGNHNCIITYGSNEFLMRVYTDNYDDTMQATRDGFAAWSDLNPQLEFVYVDHDPLVWIDWVEYTPEYVGVTCIWCLYTERSMEVVLYGYNCRGDRINLAPDYVRNIIAHEFGHMLGLEHHTDQEHLMYGPEYQVDPYETHGYVVPTNLQEFFIGEAELSDKIQALENELDILNNRIDNLAAQATLEGNVLLFDTQGQVDRYEQLIEEYNVVWYMYDDLWDERECMYEARVPGH